MSGNSALMRRKNRYRTYCVYRTVCTVLCAPYWSTLYLYVVIVPQHCLHYNTKHYMLCTVLYRTVHSVVYCTVLYYTVLYCTVLSCTVLYCIVLYCTELWCTVCSTLCCIALYAVHCTVLCWSVLYYIVTHCTLLYRSALYSIVVHRVISDNLSLSIHLFHIDLLICRPTSLPYFSLLYPSPTVSLPTLHNSLIPFPPPSVPPYYLPS